MSVSSRNNRMSLVVSGLIGGVLLGGTAIAQSVTVPIVRTAPTDSNNCCNIPENQVVEVPGVRAPGASIVVGAGNAGHGYTTHLQSGAAAAGAAYYFRNSGGYAVTAPYEGSVLNNLQVEGGSEYTTKMVTEEVPVTEEYCAPAEMSFMARPVQALCIDDKGAPHPASQVFADEHVDAAHSGEIFRCMAGTSMQVTVGNYTETGTVFDGGQTFSCQKGEALVHNIGGQLSCAPQKPMRNCNERSLLRRHGPGVKSVEMEQACVPGTRTVMQKVTREVQVERPITSSGRIVLDGGVGQNVY